MASELHRLELGIVTCLLLAVGGVAAVGTVVSAPEAYPQTQPVARGARSVERPASALPWTAALTHAATSPSLVVRSVTWAGLAVPLAVPLAVGLLLCRRRHQRARDRAVDGLLHARMPPSTPLRHQAYTRVDHRPSASRAQAVLPRSSDPASAPIGNARASRGVWGSWFPRLRTEVREKQRAGAEAQPVADGSGDGAVLTRSVDVPSHPMEETAAVARSQTTPPDEGAQPVDASGHQQATLEPSLTLHKSRSPAESLTTTLEQLLATQPEVDEGADTQAPPPEPAVLDDHVLATVSAVNAAITRASCAVRVLAVDAHADRTDLLLAVNGDDDTTIDHLLAQLRQQVPALRYRWAQPTLSIAADTPIQVPDPPLPILLPVITRGKQREVLRYIALQQWHHLAIYGADAVGVCHHLLTLLCAQQRPDDVAVAFVDPDDVIAPLYRRAPHVIDLGSDTGCAALERLGAAIKRRPYPPLRPLVVVVVRPDDAMLAALDAVLARCQLVDSVPLHLLLIQESLRSDGRPVYAALPALVVSGGQGAPSWLPGIAAWPSGDHAILTMGTVRSVGHALVADDVDAVHLLDTMRDVPLSTVPTLLTVADLPQDAMDDATGAGDSPDNTQEAPSMTAADHPIDAEPQAAPRTMVRRWSLPTDAAPSATFSGVLHTDLPSSRPPWSDQDAVMTGDEQFDTEGEVDLPASALRALETALDGHGAADVALAGPPMRAAGGTDEHGPGDLAVRPSNAPDAAVARTPTHPALDLGADGDQGVQWPAGPPPLAGRDLGELVYLMVTTPPLIEGHGAGLTKNRIKAFLQAYRGSDVLAKQLIVWFDHAGVVVPIRTDLRWREPRPLASTDLRRIAAALSAVPWVDAPTAQATYDEGVR